MSENLPAKYSGGLIPKADKEKPDLDPLEELRKLALSLNPKHGDKLYPLEVLGTYHIVNKNPMKWNFDLGGSPESFVDDQITKWLNECDINKFRNRLERSLVLDENIKNIFLLRLNYALLLEEGKDEIKIHRGRTTKLEWYGAKDEFGNSFGTSGSSVDLMKDAEALDALADSFYSYEEVLSSVRTGTKLSTKQKIVVRLVQFGYKLNMDLDDVYSQLNKYNAAYLEEGLVARIAYVAFESENTVHKPNITNGN